MKIIQHVGPTCDCYEKLRQFARNMAAGGQPFHLGSIVECGCGQQYKLVDTQMEGEIWTKHPKSIDALPSRGV